MALSTRTKCWATSVVAVVVIAIALGVGLGVGLKNRHNEKEPANPDEAVDRIRKADNLPAFGIAQIKGNITAVAVSGVRKYGSQPAVQQTDPFHLGSLTKSMTATILASYIAEGSLGLSWTTTIAKALQGTELESLIHPGHSNTTLQMLTAQYSGIVSQEARNATFVAELRNMTSIAGSLEYARRQLSQPPQNLSNSSFKYENFNYILVGLIMALRTNQTYDRIIQTRLFEPLGMTDCGLGYLPETSNTSIDSPWPHLRNNDSAHTPIPLDGVTLNQRDNPPAYDSAGRVHCPLASYEQYLRLHINGSLGLPVPAPFSAMNTQDFKFLHTPYRPSDGSQSDWLYAPGGWLSRVSTPGFIWHDGSNLFNYAYAFVRAGSQSTSVEGGDGGIVATNVGYDVDLVTDSVGDMLYEVMSDMVKGDVSLI